MKKPSDESGLTFEDLIGLGGHSARKSYYPELLSKIEELEAERNRYKWLFENALHGIFQAELDGTLTRANRALARICGYSDQEQMEARVNLARDLLSEPQELERIRRQLAQTGQLFLYETRLRRTDGSPVDVSMNILLRQEGDTAIIEAFVADITERKRVQQRMRTLNEELEHRVGERTRELVSLNDRLWHEVSIRQQAEQAMQQAKEAAEAANLSKDKYLAAASHDLLQPLNAARLLVAALQERNLPSSESELVDRVHLALDGAEHLLTDLLDISRLDQNAVQPEMQSFPVERLLQGLQAEFEPVAQQAGLHFRVRASSHWISSDLRLLTRILRNLLSNAFRYTDRGGVLIGFRRRGDRLLIQVWDTGGGIPKDQQRAIFDEFCRLSQHRSRKAGVGLGLAIVDRIARMLEHPVGLNSRPGSGSCFELSVPLVCGNRTMLGGASREPVSTPNDVLNGRRILVLDNDHAILASMDALLGGWGCEVLLAEDLDMAQQQLQSQPAELILADYHLEEGTTGLDLLDRMQALKLQRVPVVMLTADRSDGTRKAFREAGVRVLNKPVKPGKLRALMSHLLDASD